MTFAAKSVAEHNGAGLHNKHLWNTILELGCGWKRESRDQKGSGSCQEVVSNSPRVVNHGPRELQRKKTVAPSHEAPGPFRPAIYSAGRGAAGSKRSLEIVDGKPRQEIDTRVHSTPFFIRQVARPPLLRKTTKNPSIIFAIFHSVCISCRIFWIKKKLILILLIYLLFYFTNECSVQVKTSVTKEIIFAKIWKNYQLNLWLLKMIGNFFKILEPFFRFCTIF